MFIEIGTFLFFFCASEDAGAVIGIEASPPVFYCRNVSQPFWSTIRSDNRTASDMRAPVQKISSKARRCDWSVLTAAAQAIFEAEGYDNRAQAAALAGVNWSKDIIVVIAYGTNDFRGTAGAGVPIGADTDMTGATFKGAINLSISSILTAYPHIKLMFMTPLWRSRVNVSGDDSNVTPNGSGVFLKEYSQTIKDRASSYQLPVADLYAKSGISILNWQTYMPDGLHPATAQGAQRLADFTGAELETLF